MKIIKHYYITPQKITDFIKSCRDAHLDFSTTWKPSILLFDCTITTKAGYYDVVISDLHSIVEDFDLTYEQKDAINTAILSIKTLSDMGVIE